MIREAIKAAFSTSGMTQKALAKACEMTQGNLSEFLSGKHDIRSETADRLCAVLGLALRQTK